MTRRRKRVPLIDLNAILNEPVKVKLDNTEAEMHPFEAQAEQCANAALKGSVRDCIRFIKWSLQNKLIAKISPVDDHQYVARIPKDWVHDEFLAMYERYGRPPWPGRRDGLTADAREQLKKSRKIKRRPRT